MFGGSKTGLALAVFVSFGAVGCGPTAAQIEARDTKARYHYELAFGHYFDPVHPNGDAAMREIHLSLEIKPNDAEAHHLAGLILMGRQLFLDAEIHFKTALRLRPKFPSARNNLGATYLSMERWQDAVSIFEALTKDYLHPKKGHAHNNLGWAYYKLGRVEDAIEQFRLAKSFAQDLCPAYNNLGMAYLDRKRYRRSEKNLRLAIKKCPQYAEAHFNLGRLLVARQQLEDAKSSFKRCAKHGGETRLADRCLERLSAMGVNR